MKNETMRGLRAMVLALGAVALGTTLTCDRAFAQNTAESIDDYADPQNSFFNALGTGARAGTMLRFSQFSRSKPNDSGPSAEAAGLGGWLFGETGEYKGFLSFGGALAYVAPVSAPDGHGGNFVLKDPNQDGYAVVGVAFAKARYEDHSLTVGRISPQYGWSLDGVYRFYNRYDGAFVGRRDVRAMIPLAYEGASVQGKFLDDTVRYYGGFMHSMKQINDTSFKNLASAALLPGDSNGMPFGGAQWKINKDLMLQGGYQQAENILDMGWIDLDYVYRLGKDQYLRVDVQYLHQKPNGDNNLGAFSNANKAAYFEARWWAWWIPYLAVGRNTDGDELRAPFSLGPSYLVQRIGENAKAGEHTWILGSTFDFATLGLPGLAFDVTYGQRTDRHVKNNTAQPLSDWTEGATDLIYTLGKSAGLFEGMRFRARWARVWEDGQEFAGGTINPVDRQQTDVRFDMQWRYVFK